jgi:hypothetical protein
LGDLGFLLFHPEVLLASSFFPPLHNFQC